MRATGWAHPRVEHLDLTEMKAEIENARTVLAEERDKLTSLLERKQSKEAEAVISAGSPAEPRPAQTNEIQRPPAVSFPQRRNRIKSVRQSSLAERSDFTPARSISWFSVSLFFDKYSYFTEKFP
jgi:hypothetical protein